MPAPVTLDSNSVICVVATCVDATCVLRFWLMSHLAVLNNFNMDGLCFLSLNCHGLSDDIVCYLSSIIPEFDFVLLQETWLSNFNSHRLSNISHDFIYFHNSSMETKLTCGILTGRPFGGTAILVRRCFADKVSIIPSNNPRITAICCANSGQPDLFIDSVYMPSA